MKKTLISFFLFSICFCINADNIEVVLNPAGNQHDHFEHYPIADMPDAVYYDNVTHEIVIEADGTSLYYNVQIVSNQLQQTVISTQVSGYGDTIDVSSLSSGLYTIVITSQFYNMYEGYVVI